ncbi:MAG: hypothetical protein JKY14_04095, partial [Paraglaciecola sp.]|nr:hypothetical protein [Paraglaciecola sp.]
MMTCHRILRGKIGGRVTNLVMGVILFTLPVFSYALNVVVTVDNHLKAPSNYLMHRVVVSNTDSTTRSNVVLTTNVPTGSVIYESSMLPSSDNSCPSTTCDVGETPTWNLGSMSPGEFRVLTIPILIISSTADGSTLNFDIAVTYDGASSASTTSIETKVASSPVAALSISADHQVVASGGKVSYQVSFGNIGSSGFATTALSVSIPSGLSLVSASDDGSQSGSNIVWDIGVLNGGDGSKRYFTLKVDDAAQQGNIYVNQAVLSNSGSELVTSGESVVIRENLALSLDVTMDMDVLQPDNYAYYRYVVANTGSTSLTDVELNVMMAERSRFYELSS